MNSFFLIFVGLPILEIILMIEIGGRIGVLNTVLLIFLTAITGIYFAKMEGLKTIQTGIVNTYKNKIPIFEILSGASIAVAALLLIVPGFITDAFGFLLLAPITRKLIINFFIRRKNLKPKNTKEDILDGEIIEDKKDEL